MKKRNTKINLCKFLLNNPIIYVKLRDKFIKEIKRKILQRHGSLKQYSLVKKTGVCYGTLKYNFREGKYFKLDRFLKIVIDLNISESKFFDSILVFFALGSNTKRELFLQKNLIVDENFVEGYSLYLAEGDSGFSGKTKPRKVRFTNSDLDVIRYFIKWLRKYFPSNYFYLNVINPLSNKIPGVETLKEIKGFLNIIDSQLKITNGYYNRQIKYRVCLDQAILIDLLLSMEEKIKSLCINNKKLARAYIRGMMTGEGTVYLNRSRYIRIEMKNQREIKYLASLLKFLNYEYKVTQRSNRINMWNIYIGASNLKRFSEEIGFGSQKRRQAILNKAACKKLKVNQYV